MEELYLLQRLARGLGSDNVDFRLRHSDFRADGARAGAPWLGMKITDLAQLDRVLVIGSFLRKDHPLIAHRLRQDPRVRLLERTNARYLKPEDVGEPVDFVAVDVSFISATLVLPAVIGAARGEAPRRLELVVLVKPQFEAGRQAVGKGGIVRDAEAQMEAVEKVRRAVIELGASQTESIDSPILGAEGNREFLLHAVFEDL